MLTTKELIKDLEKLNINPNGTLFVHSSYKSIGNVENRGNGVIDAFMEYMKDGLLVLPTHTWDYIRIDKETVMDVAKTPVCIGILPELFRARKGVHRSLHPTHSVGAYGKDAVSFIENEEKSTTPCGRDFIYGKLLDRKATIMLVGVNFTRNTFIHCIEEIYDVPGRLTENAHELYVKGLDGKIHSTPQFRHCAGLGSQTFWKLESLMEEKGVIYKGKFGNAPVIVCDAYKLEKTLGKMLSIDIDILTDNGPLEDFWYDKI